MSWHDTNSTHEHELPPLIKLLSNSVKIIIIYIKYKTWSLFAHISDSNVDSDYKNLEHTRNFSMPVFRGFKKKKRWKF